MNGNSMIPSDADYDAHFVGHRKHCDQCGEKFEAFDEDEDLCELCAEDASAEALEEGTCKLCAAEAQTNFPAA